MEYMRKLNTGFLKEGFSFMIYTITGMSSSGKTTLVNELVKRYPDQFVRLRTATTRRKRRNEADDAYEFLKNEEFDVLKQRHDIFCTTEFAGHKYGIPYMTYDFLLADVAYAGKNQDILVVLDREGAINAPDEKLFCGSVQRVYINVDNQQKKRAKKRNWRRYKADIEAGLDKTDGYDCVLYNDHKSLDDLVYNFMNYKIAVNARIKYRLE